MTSIVGQTVSHYRILEDIGHGGMGRVYKAEDLSLGRVVAVKFLPSDSIPDAETKARFVREARAASALDHANIGTIHEIGETSDHEVFIVMGYYGGEDLRTKIGRGPLKSHDIVHFASQICAGLAKVHEKGIIHRDIKPGNVVITSDGEAKILDFGLAQLGGHSSLTKSGHTVGTAAYMSPEQVQGSALDGRSDLFSLGSTMYEMATAKKPFEGDHEAAIMYSIIQSDPPPPSRFNKEISPELDTVILKLLSKNPANRYQQAADVRTDLLQLSDAARHPTRERKGGVKKYLLFLAGLAVVGILSWMLMPGLLPHPSVESPWRIGIVPFQVLAVRDVPSDWPQIVQTMMADHLNGVEELRVIDPFTFNSLLEAGKSGSGSVMGSARQAGAGMIINGALEKLDTSFVLRCTLVDVADGSVKLSDAESFGSERDLPQAVKNASAQILSYFQIQTMSGDRRTRLDLQPWLNHRTKDLQSIKVFIQGAQLMGRWQPGGEKFFKRAIELDSTFITPRTWLIAGLVSKGRVEEARPHQEYLNRHVFDVGPFEQALIRWTGAMIAGDYPAQEKALEIALDYSPNNQVLRYILSDTRATQGEYQAAIDAIRPTIEGGWTFQPAWFELGWCLFELRRFDESRKVLTQSLSLVPLLPETNAILAAIAFRDGDDDLGRRESKECVRLATAEHADPDSIYGMLGKYTAIAGTHKQAAEFYAKAIELNRSIVAYRIGYATSALEIGDTTVALRQFAAYLAVDSTSARAGEVRKRVQQLLTQ